MLTLAFLPNLLLRCPSVNKGAQEVHHGVRVNKPRETDLPPPIFRAAQINDSLQLPTLMAGE
jgi:hypothetical protein